jgi:hypothetical protein
MLGSVESPPQPTIVRRAPASSRMKKLPLLLLTAAASLAAGDKPAWFADPTLQARLGFDTNPLGAGGSTIAVLGAEDTFTASAGLGFALVAPTGSARGTAARFTYAVDTFRFDRWSEENHTTHRFGATGQIRLGAWKLSADASSLYIDGSRDTYLSLANANANATTLWRERREQWQHRAKLAAQRDLGAYVLRFNGSLLAYDYLTHVEAGHVGFADRRDLLAGADFGWKPSGNALVFAGVRAGWQSQDQVPLPNCAFDYSSRYTRLVAGWEGKLGSATTLAVSAGPDFRHFDGDVDTRVFAGRDRTSLWLEASATTKLTSTLTLTGKATRWVWLSSTGKSAYIDFCIDSALAWNVTPATALRLTAKAHESDYFPTVRQDWESFAGFGATYKVNAALTLSADLLIHRGWNELTDLADRAFSRTVASVGATYKF